jgi:hypothetical protein
MARKLAKQGPIHHTMRPRLLAVLTVVAACLVSQPAHAIDDLTGASMGWPWALPFIGILLSIATNGHAMAAALPRSALFQLAAAAMLFWVLTGAVRRTPTLLRRA